MKEELLKLSKEKEFLSRDCLIDVNSSYYYLWMCELQFWLRNEHQIYIEVLTDCTTAPKFCFDIKRFIGYPKDLTIDWYWEKPEFEFYLYRTYEETLEEALILSLNLI